MYTYGQCPLTRACVLISEMYMYFIQDHGKTLSVSKLKARPLNELLVNIVQSKHMQDAIIKLCHVTVTRVKIDTTPALLTWCVETWKARWWELAYIQTKCSLEREREKKEEGRGHIHATEKIRNFMEFINNIYTYM